MENAGKVIGGLLAGAAVGATLGLLLAPSKGNKTREKLLSNAKGFTDGWKGKISNEIDKFVEAVSSFKLGAEKTIADSKKVVKTKVAKA